MLHITIGRNRQSDFRLENGSVSRVHAVLKTQSDGLGNSLRLEDVGSRNGTYVRKGEIWQRIDGADILKTDRVRFGEEDVNIEDILKSIRKRPKIGGSAKDDKTGKRPKIGKQAIGSAAGDGSGDKPLKKFVKPRRNHVTGDIEEGG